MRKNFLIFRVTRFLKVVHVELAHERREVVVFEILWEHLIRKLVWLVDDKAIAVYVPVDSFVVGRVLLNG